MRIWSVLLATVLWTSHGAENQGSIIISGVMPEISRLAITPEPKAASLNLAAGEQEAVIAQIVEVSNARRGYKVLLESANAKATGKTDLFLRGSDPSNSSTISYQLTYSGQPVNLDGTGAAVIAESANRTPTEGAQKELQILLPPSEAQPDRYSDTLTLTLINN